MPVTFKPRFALAAGWDIKENGWGDAVTQNFCKIDNLIFPAVVSVGSPPPANNVGEQYIDAEGNIQTYVDGAYVECAPKKGMFVYDCTTNCILAYNGTGWFDIIGAKAGAGGGTVITLISDLTDVDTSGAATGQYLSFDGSNWVPVDITIPTTIGDLTGIDLTGITQGQTLCWNATTLALEPANKTVPISQLGELGDVDLTGLTNGQVLCYDSTLLQFIPADKASGGAAVINDLTDVDTATTAPTTGDLLSWDGTNWVPATVPGLTTAIPRIFYQGATAQASLPTSSVSGSNIIWGGTDYGTTNNPTTNATVNGNLNVNVEGRYIFIITAVLLVNNTDPDDNPGGQLDFVVIPNTGNPTNMGTHEWSRAFLSSWNSPDHLDTSSSLWTLQEQYTWTYWLHPNDNVQVRMDNFNYTGVVLNGNTRLQVMKLD